MQQCLDKVTCYLAERGISIDDVLLACESYRLYSEPLLEDIIEGTREMEFLFGLARVMQSNLTNRIWLFAPRHGPGSYIKDGMPWVKCWHGMPVAGLYRNQLWRSIVISTWMNHCCNP